MIGASAVPDHFREQAGWCRDLGSPFTADLLLQFAEDFAAKGPVYALTADWAGSPRKDALGLRLTGYLHYVVLSGGAPDLASQYPATREAWDMAAVWPLARDYLSRTLPDARRFIQGPPQTNETRRSIALLPGFQELAARFDMPMHLLELGASAGLNQNWDRYSYATRDWQRLARPDSGVTITTDWSGPAPRHLSASPDIASRAACDLNPIDLSDPAQTRHLKAYTWPDQTERLARLDAAITLARATGIVVEKADAAAWLEAKLAARPDRGLTVIYHSVFLIYPPREVITRIMNTITGAGQAATNAAPVAWLSFEPESLFGGAKESPKMHTRLQIWPGGDTRLLAVSDGHVTRMTLVD